MTIEAVSFDLGASASVRLQLVSSDGLAPLPMPFNGKDDKFSQLLDGGVGGRSPDVSRGLAALSWTIEKLRREPSDATKVSCLTHESPVPVVVDSAATPKETRCLAASEAVVQSHPELLCPSSTSRLLKRLLSSAASRPTRLKSRVLRPRNRLFSPLSIPQLLPRRRGVSPRQRLL